MSIQGNWDTRRLVSRRAFLGLSSMSAAALMLGTGAVTSSSVLAQPNFLEDPFKLGVASGDPLPDGFVLWTKLAPEPFAEDGSSGMPQENFGVRYEVAEDEGFKRIVKRGAVEAVPELGHSVHAEVSGLLPGREYFYRFKAGPEVSPVGRIKTAPATGASVGSMSFAFASCQQWQKGYYTAYRRMAEEDLDVAFHVGDYIYDGTIRNDSEFRAHLVPDHVRPDPVDLTGYRLRYALYKTDADLRAAHASFPFVVTFDDHEFVNDFAGDQPPQFERRAAAFQAYYEHLPLRAAATPRGPDMLLYRRLTYGDLAEFNVLDTRQYRSDQACGDGLKEPCEEVFDPSRTMTGPEQERWLLDGMDRSAARWNVIAQQVMMARMDRVPGEGEAVSMDDWNGYVPARQRILDFMGSRPDVNPVVLTGDMHIHLQADLKEDFQDPESRTVGTEFVGTSITSQGGLRYGDGSDSDPRATTWREDNPWISYILFRRGYTRCTLTPETWTTDYRVVPYISEPGAPVSTHATFVLEDGKPGAVRA